MKQAAVEVDLNKRLGNVRVDIPSNHTGSASITIQNLGFGTVESIIFSAKAYDGFNRQISVEGNDIFEFKIDGICIEANAERMYIVDLPDKSIVRMELTEKMISYYGGTVFEYKTGNILKFNADLLENNDEEKEVRELFSSKTMVDAVCLPKKYKGYWMCACKTVNADEHKKCTGCNTAMNVMFDINKLLVIGQNSKKQQVVMTRERVKRNVQGKFWKTIKLVVVIALLCGISNWIW
ncbi:MAG: hypothetical protein K6G26_13600 [Lachnospiraceae bacterium]|nr:hypothetical protein [Lachnospiraceae bacterium]